MDSGGGDGMGEDSGVGGESSGAAAAEGPKKELSREVGEFTEAGGVGGLGPAVGIEGRSGE